MGVPFSRYWRISLANNLFLHPSLVWRRLAEERPAISTQSIHRWNAHLMGYNSVADTIAEFNVHWHYASISIRLAVLIVASQNHEITRNSDKIWSNSSSKSSRVIDFGVNRKTTCDFLLVIHTVTLAVSATVFEILTLKAIENDWFFLPILVWRPRSGGPIRISGWNLPRKN